MEIIAITKSHENASNQMLIFVLFFTFYNVFSSISINQSPILMKKIDKIIKKTSINMALKSLEKLSSENKYYLSGFLDADGCILTQIVKGSSCKYGYTVRVSVVFYQLNKRYWFLMQLKDSLGMGALRQKKDERPDTQIGCNLSV